MDATMNTNDSTFVRNPEHVILNYNHIALQEDELKIDCYILLSLLLYENIPVDSRKLQLNR